MTMHDIHFLLKKDSLCLCELEEICHKYYVQALGVRQWEVVNCNALFDFDFAQEFIVLMRDDDYSRDLCTQEGCQLANMCLNPSECRPEEVANESDCKWFTLCIHYKLFMMLGSQLIPKTHKKIGPYVISYDESNLCGEGLHGQVRIGFQPTTERLFAIRIIAMPLSLYMQAYLARQSEYSLLPEVQKLRPPVCTASYYYLPLQYFPKTFESELPKMREDSFQFQRNIQAFLTAYAYVYSLGIAHGNLSLRNIGITQENSVKLMDFAINCQNFEETNKKDFADFKRILEQIEPKLTFRDRPIYHKLNHPNWDSIFEAWGIVKSYSRLWSTKNDTSQHRCAIVHKLNSSLDLKVKQTQNLSLAIRRISVSENIIEGDKSREDKDVMRMNATIMSAIRDCDYFGMNTAQRFALIGILIQSINHEYLLELIRDNWDGKERKLEFRLLGDHLISINFEQIKQLIQK